MQNHTVKAQPSIPGHKITQLKELIENSFMHDWVIRIEYAINSSKECASWAIWGKSFFAITDSTQVLEKIIECCMQNPECSMRIICERVNPGCRFVHSIH